MLSSIAEQTYAPLEAVSTINGSLAFKRSQSDIISHKQ